MINGVSQCIDHSFACSLRRCDARQADLLAPDAPQVTFVSGVLGPLIGADLLHLRKVEALDTGIAGIGAPARLMVSCSPEESRPIWHEQRPFMLAYTMGVAPLFQDGANFPISPRWTEE
jgi:hypothetical protein